MASISKRTVITPSKIHGLFLLILLFFSVLAHSQNIKVQTSNYPQIQYVKNNANYKRDLFSLHLVVSQTYEEDILPLTNPNILIDCDLLLEGIRYMGTYKNNQVLWAMLTVNDGNSRYRIGDWLEDIPLKISHISKQKIKLERADKATCSLNKQSF